MLEEHGGLMEKEYLLDILVGFSVNGFDSDEEKELQEVNNKLAALKKALVLAEKI